MIAHSSVKCKAAHCTALRRHTDSDSITEAAATSLAPVRWPASQPASQQARDKTVADFICFILFIIIIVIFLKPFCLFSLLCHFVQVTLRDVVSAAISRRCRFECQFDAYDSVTAAASVSCEGSRQAAVGGGGVCEGGPPTAQVYPHPTHPLQPPQLPPLSSRVTFILECACVSDSAARPRCPVVRM